MRLSPQYFVLVAVASLLLGGCAGWMGSRSGNKDLEAEWKPQKIAPARPVKAPVEITPTTVRPSESGVKASLSKEPPSKEPLTKSQAIREAAVESRGPKQPAPENRDTSLSDALAQIKARGDLSPPALADLQLALRESDPTVRDLLVQTLLAASKKKDEPVAAPKVDLIAATKPVEEPALSAKPPATVSAVPAKEVASPTAPTSVPSPVAPPLTTPPLTTTPPLPPNWKDELGQAIKSLEAELASKSVSGDDRTRLEAQLRLLYLAADRRKEALEPIRELDESRREFWKSQLHAAGVLLDPKGPPADDRRAALALRHVREAADHLAGASTLDVRNLAFVSKVESYGRFTEFPKSHFRADQEVLLYVEVDNFTVESKSQGYETALEASYQIFDSAGQRVAEHNFPAEKETCRRPRRDFFIPYRLYMPKAITPGDYTLQLAIKDVKGDKFGQGTIRFSIEPGAAPAR